MVLDKLGNSLKNTLSKISSALFVDEKLVNELVKDIQRALLQSDVNVKFVLDFSKKIKKRFLDEKAPPGITKNDFLINIVYEELVQFLGGQSTGIQIGVGKQGEPFKIMLVGLFGNGKTTTAGKLANYYKKRSIKLALIQTDTWRPAAYEQLKQLGKQIGVPVFGDPTLKTPSEVFQKFSSEFKNFDLLIVDTAGRDALNEELVEELKELTSTVKPDETILVMNADIGKSAQKQAELFKEYANVTGVIISKMDGTAKAGGALVACSITGANVKFIGVGEKIQDLEEFKPKNFVGRILGMGDLDALLAKVQDAFDEVDAEDMGRKFLKGEFNLLDLYDQVKSIKKMGSLSSIMKLIPGMGKLNISKDMLNSQQENLEKWTYLMNSMTKNELENPDIIKGTRLERISDGSGVPIQNLRQLLKQYKQSKKMMKLMKGNFSGSDKDMKKMMNKMKGMKGLKNMPF